MLSCRECSELLPQYVADGEPAVTRYAGVREHLATCATCRAYCAHLRRVEGMLRGYPRFVAPVGISTQVMVRVRREEQAQPESWHWLPWDVWVPFVAIFLALLMASFSLVHDAMISGAPLTDVAAATDMDSLYGWTSQISLYAEQDAFWAVWTGVFLSLAALGIGIGLASLNPPDDHPGQTLSTRVSHVTDWLSGFLRREA